MAGMKSLLAGLGAFGLASLPLVALPPDMHPFVIPPEGVQPGTAPDVSFLNAPADRRIVVRDGVFVDETTGRRVRFWATNIGGPELFRASRDEITRTAQRLSRAGINLVRLHHLDNPWDRVSGYSIWKADQHKLEIDPAKLDHVHFAIAEFKKAGIYTNLNTKVSKEMSAADGLPIDLATVGHWTDGFPHQKRVDRFSRVFIDHARQIARELWTSRNPYTGLTLAEDPALAFGEINNENGILNLWPGMALGQGLEALPAPFVAELTGLWNDWLARTYPTQASLLQAWGQDTEPLGPSVATSTTPWLAVSPGATEITVDQRSPASPGVAPGATFTVTRTTGTDWHAQAVLAGMSIDSGRMYTLRFRARASTPRSVRVSVDLTDSPWSNVGIDRSIALTPEFQAFSMIFHARGTRPDGGNRIAFHLGAITGETEIVDLSLSPGTDMPLVAPGQSLEARNIAINPAVTRAMSRDWIDFLVELDHAYTAEMTTLLRRDLGVKSLLADTQVQWGDITGFNRERDSDFIDTHSYFNHPIFTAGAWDPANYIVHRTSLVDTLARGEPGTLGDLALHRRLDKPFAVSEYDHPAPNDFGVEMMPLFATFAVLHDWDALYTFAHGPMHDAAGLDRIHGYFDQSTNPAKFGFNPAAAMLLRQGLIPRLDSARVLELPAKPWHTTHRVGDTWAAAGAMPVDFLTHRTGVLIDRPALRLNERSGQTPSPARIVTTPAGPVFVASSDRAVVLAGYLGGQTLHAGDVVVRIDPFEGNFGSLVLTPLDDQPIASSQRMLLTVSGRAENVGMGWNADRTSVGNSWGSGPAHIQCLGGSLTLPAEGLKAFALHPDGTRAHQATLQGATLTLSPAHATMWYELVRE